MDAFLSRARFAGEVVQSRGTSCVPSHEVARHSARALALKHHWAVSPLLMVILSAYSA